jgi:hypothetical protein
VHTMVGLVNLLLVVVGSLLALGLLQFRKAWVLRRDIQLLILAAPAMSLGIGFGGLSHVAGRICLIALPPWGETFSVLLFLAMGLVGIGAVGLGCLRLWLLAWRLPRPLLAAPPTLRELGNGLAQQLGVSPPSILVCPQNRPLALTSGLWRPTVILSSWMLAHLDRRELEAVLAHEISHIARCDLWGMWVATVLRDVFFYLPTSQIAYRQLQAEKELACDDLAISVTRRPLALASALTKVWHHAVESPPPALLPSLTGLSVPLETRITRLLRPVSPSPSPKRSPFFGLGIGSAACVLLLVELINGAALFSPLDCHPVLLLWRLFQK